MTEPHLQYWGYEPASAELMHAISKVGITRAHELRKQCREESRQIRAAGFNSRGYGYKSRRAAQRKADWIEKSVGVKMRIYQHDYL